MPLTKADKEFIELSLKPIAQRLDDFKEINNKQDERLEKMEERFQVNDKTFVTTEEYNNQNKRGATCPNLSKIEEVKMTQEATKVTKKFMIKIGAFLGGFVAFMWGLVQLANFFFG